jgi:RNase P/RNase MRP subunit p29
MMKSIVGLKGRVSLENANKVAFTNNRHARLTARPKKSRLAHCRFLHSS